MATYKQIQDYVKENYNFVPKTCWIAHMKEVVGLDSKRAHNRISENVRKYPCPKDKQQYLENAFRHFNMID